jgi:hypothetical protein
MFLNNSDGGGQMITVAILINGNPIVARNAVNQNRKNKKGQTAYKTDSGEIIYHDPKDGAVALAKKLLDTIMNDK